MSSKPKEDRKSEHHETAAKQSESAKISVVDSARHEEIRIRAYEIYIERCGQPGHDRDDWLQAERKLQPKVRHARAGQ